MNQDKMMNFASFKYLSQVASSFFLIIVCVCVLLFMSNLSNILLLVHSVEIAYNAMSMPKLLARVFSIASPLSQHN
jgi:hypothetical protein